ncbi:MAG TPA: hypothetical protein VGM28_01560 [Candidatus Limnocylindrales bacterium]|jgi:hypothetical protein
MDPLPVLQWERHPTGEEATGHAFGTGSISSKRIGFPPSVKVSAEIAAGPNLARVSDAMSRHLVLDLVYTTKSGQVMELFGVLIDRMSSSSKGPGEVQIGLVAEQARTR